MIRLEKNKKSTESKDIIINAETAQYDDNALIECTDRSGVKNVSVAYQAQFLKYGGMVYQYSDNKELGQAILEIDPESTHSAAVYVRTLKQLSEQMDEGSLNPESVKDVVGDEPEVLGEEIEEEVVPEEEEEVEEEPVVIPPLDVDVATTTPSIITTTSTPSTDIPDVTVSSTTPTIDIEPEPTIERPVKEEEPIIDDASSTAGEIVAYAKKKVKKTIRKKLGF